MSNLRPLLVLLLIASVGCGRAMVPDGYVGDAFKEEVVTMSSALTFDGMALGDFTVVSHIRTGFEDRRQRVQITLRDVEGATWHASCLQAHTPIEWSAGRTDVACDLAPMEAGPEAGASMVLGGEGMVPLSGHLVGAAQMTLEGVPTFLVTAEHMTPFTAFWRRGTKDEGGDPLGTMMIGAGMPRLWVNPDASREDRRWMELVTLLKVMLDDPREKATGMTYMDGYVTRPRTAPLAQLQERDAAVEVRAKRLDGLGAPQGASLLRELAAREREREFDMEAGPAVKRRDSVIRGPAIELQAGPVLVPNQDGGLSGGLPNGGHLHVGGGLRLGERGTVMLQFGLQFPSVAFDDLPDSTEAPGRVSSAAMAIGLHGRYAFGAVGRLEPVIGLSVRTRLSFMDYAHPDDPTVDDELSTTDGVMLGFGFAPTIGAQLPLDMNEYGSRIVFFTELVPELTFWTWRSTSVNQEQLPGANRAGEIFEGVGEEPSLQLMFNFGIRLEL